MPSKYRSQLSDSPTKILWAFLDCFCGLVVTDPGYRSSGFDYRRYQIFWQLVDLEWGPLSLVRIIEVLLERKSSGSGLESSSITTVGSRCAETLHPSLTANVAINFGEKWRLPIRYSSLGNKIHNSSLLPPCHESFLYRLECLGRSEHRIWRMPSSVTCRRVALVRTDVSEEISTPIIRLKIINELEKR
jgi:hypothetical protein